MQRSRGLREPTKRAGQGTDARKSPRKEEISTEKHSFGDSSAPAGTRTNGRPHGDQLPVLQALADFATRKQAENKAEDSHPQMIRERAFFESVMRQLGIGVAIFEFPSGNLIMANDDLNAIFKKGISAFTHISSFRKIRAFQVSNSMDEGTNWPLARSLRSGEDVSYKEVVLEGTKGGRTTVQVSSCPVYDDQKQMIAVVAVFIDVTERKRIKQEIIDISSREHQRIAHDLHDGLGQELAAIVYRIKAMKSRLARVSPGEAEEAGEIGDLAETALAKTRDLVRFLQPVALDERGLMQSLHDLANSSSRLYRIACEFICPEPIALVNPNSALHVYRIAQEAVHNAVKHGKPKNIVIGLRKHRHRTELTISNDGLDFDPALNERKRGLGLHIMSYRANVLCGELTIERRHPRGTTVKCIF